VEAVLSRSAGARRRYVVTESYFSMEGDSPDLPRLRALCDAHDAALVVDEAHALGVFGPDGAGLCKGCHISADVLIGTLGKAVGLQGAFVAGPGALRSWLWNRARSFVFSTGISPALAGAIRARLRQVVRAGDRRERLTTLSAELRTRLATEGVDVSSAEGPILPWIVGAPEAAVSASLRLRDHGVIVQAIRPPTVPAGTSRLRITATAALAPADIERAARAFAALRS
jgi:8-amino-7-oxononanoate synthase